MGDILNQFLIFFSLYVRAIFKTKCHFPFFQMKKFLVVVGGMKIRLILCFQGNENHNGMKKLEAGGGKVIIHKSCSEQFLWNID